MPPINNNASGFWIELESGRHWVATWARSENKSWAKDKYKIEKEEITMDGIKKLSDFNPIRVLEGENVKIQDVANKEITLKDYDQRIGINGPYIRIQAECEGKIVVFNASENVLKQIKASEEDAQKKNDTIIGAKAVVSQILGKNGHTYWSIK